MDRYRIHSTSTPSFLSMGWRLCRVALLALAVSHHARGAVIPEVPPEIVSAWKLISGDALLVFRHDGTYFHAEVGDTHVGMERGTFVWNKTTSAFSATCLRDTNGNLGLSHPAGATTLVISGNTMTYSVSGEGEYILTRVANTSSPIVGSWFIPGSRTTVTFLADGSYFHTEEKDDAPFGWDGMEKGTYTWNSTTKVLTATAAIDTNGDAGLSHLAAGFTATIVGNEMTVPDDTGTITLRRITPVTSPLNPQNDFEVDQFANYRQTGTAAPALLPGPPDDYPFWGEAYIESSVPGTGGTLTIASQAPRSFVDDGGWGIATEYASLSALNQASAFPNGANYVFARTGGTATLAFPAGGVFPAAPRITGSGDNGAWSAGEYLLGANQTLIWGAQAAYDPATRMTVLSVVDRVTGAELLYESVVQGDIVSYDFNGRLTPGRAYDVQLEHVKIAGTTTAGTGPFAGKSGRALYNSNTRLIMVAPDSAASAPVIALQPQSQQPAAGAAVVLTVRTQDQDPAQTYQWHKNGQPLAGQTGNSLSITSYSSATDAGAYTVTVTNPADSVTSEEAVLGSLEVRFVGLSKDIEYIQTGPTTVIVNPEGITPTHGGTYGFFTDVRGVNLQLLAAPTVTPPAGTQGFQGSLQYNSAESRWGYGANGDEFNTDTQTLIDTKFPNGTYTFSINGTQVPLSLPGNAYYPNTPQVTLGGGIWVNGKYAIDAANALTATTNVFAQYGSNADGHVGIWVNEVLATESYASTNPAGNVASHTIPGGSLPTQAETEIRVDFDAITSRSYAIPGAYAAGYYTKSLFVKVHVFPKITAQSVSQVVSPGAAVNLQVTATGTPASATGSLSYQWRRNGTIVPAGMAGTLALTGFSAAMSGTYTCTVSNDVGSVTSQMIDLEAGDAYQNYIAGYGLNSVTTGAPDADYDKDGIANLMEYLFGGNPTVPNRGLLPTASKPPGSGNLVFTYRRKLAATGVTQVIEHSTSLSSGWTPAVHGAGGVTITTSPVDAQTEQVTVTIPSPTSTRFARLRASR